MNSSLPLFKHDQLQLGTCRPPLALVSLGIFSRPDHAKMIYPEVQQKHELPLALICDNIRDPGNLGTILRSAAAAGCTRVLLAKGRGCHAVWKWRGEESLQGG